jgi:hypothetical protein
MTNKPTSAPLPYKLEERDGIKVRVYESGMERREDNGYIIKPAPSTVITAEKSTLLHRRREEKTAALLRQRIQQTHNSLMPTRVTTSAAAFAESGAMLYEQVVLNTEAYPRDRKETWEMLGKYTRNLPSDLRKDTGADQVQAITAALQAETAQTLERLWADVRRVQDQPSDVVDGDVSE